MRRLPLLTLTALLLAGCGLSPSDVTNLAVPKPMVSVATLTHKLVLFRYGKPVTAPIYLSNPNPDELMMKLFADRRPSYDTYVKDITFRWSTMAQSGYDGSRRDLDTRQTTLEVYVKSGDDLPEKAVQQITCTALENWTSLLRVELYRQDPAGNVSLYGAYRCKDDLTLVKE